MENILLNDIIYIHSLTHPIYYFNEDGSTGWFINMAVSGDPDTPKEEIQSVCLDCYSEEMAWKLFDEAWGHIKETGPYPHINGERVVN